MSVTKKQKSIRQAFFDNPIRCKNCNTAIYPRQGERLVEVKKRKFCSKSCAAKYNNANTPRKYKQKDPDTALDYLCQFCDSRKKSENSLRNHERLCVSNPNSAKQRLVNSELREKARKKASEKISCGFCGKKYSRYGIRHHEKACVKNPKVIEERIKTCPSCQKPFMKNSITCSNACANRYFKHGRTAEGARWKSDDQLISESKYREICFRHHEKMCVVCGESKIVAVHHLDENRENNLPENLIPLCPTHHQYTHSKYHAEVDPIIAEYIEGWYGRRDSNPQNSVSETDAYSNSATPAHWLSPPAQSPRVDKPW